MIYSTQQIEEIKRLASNLATIDEIAIMMDIDADTLREDIRTQKEVARAYNQGKTTQLLALRVIEIEQAKLGSTVAMELVNQHINNQERKEE